MVWFPTSLHNQNTSEQRILNIFQNSPGRDILIMGFILLTRRTNSQNLISVIITYGERMLTPKSDYIIRTKFEYGLSFCLRQIHDSGFLFRLKIYPVTISKTVIYLSFEAVFKFRQGDEFCYVPGVTCLQEWNLSLIFWYSRCLRREGWRCA